MDIIQYVTGGNVTIQVALITSLATLASWGTATWKLKIEKEQFEQQFNSQKDSFEEQRRQFERTLQNQKTITYKELITAERIKWLNDLRSCIINTLDIGTEIVKCGPNRDLDLCKKMFHSTDEIILRLNPNEDDMLKCVGAIDVAVLALQKNQNHNDLDELGKKLDLLRKESQVLLKKEWEQIKEEANQLYHE